MVLKDLLSEDEIREYHEEWNSFTGKYKPETSYNVHSGLPIIGQVFQFEDKPIFRAHIFKRKLKKAFDPYFTSKDGYLHPFFHTVHYFFPIEQAAHVSFSRIIPNYWDYLIIDRFDRNRYPIMEEKVNFSKNNPVSIEIIPDVKIGKNRFIARLSATFYEDRTNKSLQVWYFEGMGRLRRHLENIQRLKDGDSSAIKDLIIEIEATDVKHKKMINPRNYTPKNELIQRLNNGEIPEEELHDFFSLWE